MELNFCYRIWILDSNVKKLIVGDSFIDTSAEKSVVSAAVIPFPAVAVMSAASRKVIPVILTMISVAPRKETSPVRQMVTQSLHARLRCVIAIADHLIKLRVVKLKRSDSSG